MSNKSASPAPKILGVVIISSGDAAFAGEIEPVSVVNLTTHAGAICEMGGARDK